MIVVHNKQTIGNDSGSIIGKSRKKTKTDVSMTTRTNCG